MLKRIRLFPILVAIVFMSSLVSVCFASEIDAVVLGDNIQNNNVTGSAVSSESESQVKSSLKLASNTVIQPQIKNSLSPDQDNVVFDENFDDTSGWVLKGASVDSTGIFSGYGGGDNSVHFDENTNQSASYTLTLSPKTYYYMTFYESRSIKVTITDSNFNSLSFDHDYYAAVSNDNIQQFKLPFTTTDSSQVTITFTGVDQWHDMYLDMVQIVQGGNGMYSDYMTADTNFSNMVNYMTNNVAFSSSITNFSPLGLESGSYTNPFEVQSGSAVVTADFNSPYLISGIRLVSAGLGNTTPQIKIETKNKGESYVTSYDNTSPDYAPLNWVTYKYSQSYTDIVFSQPVNLQYIKFTFSNCSWFILNQIEAYGAFNSNLNENRNGSSMEASSAPTNTDPTADSNGWVNYSMDGYANIATNNKCIVDNQCFDDNTLYNAIDGNTTTYTSYKDGYTNPTADQPQPSLTVDLGANMATVGAFAARFPVITSARNFKIDVSNDLTNWTSEADFSNNTTTAADITKDPTGATTYFGLVLPSEIRCRYVRITRCASDNADFNITEFEIFGDDSPVYNYTEEDNMISQTDQGFEGSMWMIPSGDNVGIEPKTGRMGNSLKISGETGNAYQDLTVTPGTNYQLRGFVKVSGIDDTVGLGIMDILNEQTGGVVTTVNGSVTSVQLNAGTDYTSFTINFTTEANATKIRLMLGKFGGSGNALLDNAWFDNIVIYQGGSGINTYGVVNTQPIINQVYYQELVNKTTAVTTLDSCKPADSTTLATYDISNAIDNVDTTYWDPIPASGHTISVDLGKTQTIYATHIMMLNYAVAYKYAIYVSNDDTNWTLAVNKLNNVSLLDNSKILTDIFTMDARYVKFEFAQTAPATTNFGIIDFGIYGQKVNYNRVFPSPSSSSNTNTSSASSSASSQAINNSVAQINNVVSSSPTNNTPNIITKTITTLNSKVKTVPLTAPSKPLLDSVILVLVLFVISLLMVSFMLIKIFGKQRENN